jgi:hypothetical protein
MLRLMDVRMVGRPLRGFDDSCQRISQHCRAGLSAGAHFVGCKTARECRENSTARRILSYQPPVRMRSIDVLFSVIVVFRK